MEEGGCRLQQVSTRNIQKSESIRRKFTQPQKYHKRFRKVEYKLTVPSHRRNVESEGEMGGVGVASQAGVNLPRLAVAQTHPNPRRSVRPSGCGPCVGNTIGAQTTNRRFSLTFRPNPPHSPPPPSPAPPSKNIVFSLISLAETHGSYQGKIKQRLSFTILTADRFRGYL